MFAHFAEVMLECLHDLGITVVFATLAGVCIAAVAASDGTPLSLLSCIGYVGFLPAGVLAMIGADAALRTFSEWRSDHWRI